MEDKVFICFFGHAVTPPRTFRSSLLARGIPGRVILEGTALNHIARDFQWLTRRKASTPPLGGREYSTVCLPQDRRGTRGSRNRAGEEAWPGGCVAAGLNPHVSSECQPCSQWLSSAATGPGSDIHGGLLDRKAAKLLFLSPLDETSKQVKKKKIITG